jgi:prepilin-type N-terminal cleavage/methylation domain-containing protein
MFTKNTKVAKGFTLIEILVVIGLIAVLATIVLIAINPARQFAQANNTQRESNVNAVLNAIGQLMADTKGKWPTEIPLDGTVLTLVSTNANAVTLCNKLVPTYIPAMPTDPSSSVPFTNCSSFDAKYDIASSSGRMKVSAQSAELNATIQVVR